MEPRGTFSRHWAEQACRRASLNPTCASGRRTSVPYAAGRLVESGNAVALRLKSWSDRDGAPMARLVLLVEHPRRTIFIVGARGEQHAVYDRRCARGAPDRAVSWRVGAVAARLAVVAAASPGAPRAPWLPRRSPGRSLTSASVLAANEGSAPGDTTLPELFSARVSPTGALKRKISDYRGAGCELRDDFRDVDDPPPPPPQPTDAALVIPILLTAPAGRQLFADDHRWCPACPRMMSGHHRRVGHASAP
jgi:hypothetical protein